MYENYQNGGTKTNPLTFGTTAIPEVRRFAVVLFLLTEGESERERSGNPPPYPLLALPRGSGLLAVGTPRAPLAPNGNVDSSGAPKSAKSAFGALRTPKNVVHV